MSVWYNCFLFLFVLCKQEPSSCHLSLFVFLLLLIRYMFSWMKFRMAPRSYFNKMREIERERKRELGWEWQKVFFRLLAIWTRYVFTFFRELLLFTWIKRLLLRGCASADNDVHSFPDCCVYIKQSPETYGNVGLLSLKQFLVIPYSLEL